MAKRLASGADVTTERACDLSTANVLAAIGAGSVAVRVRAYPFEPRYALLAADQADARIATILGADDRARAAYLKDAELVRPTRVEDHVRAGRQAPRAAGDTRTPAGLKNRTTFDVLVYALTAKGRAELGLPDPAEVAHAKPREILPPGMKRCGAAWHVGSPVLPNAEFTPTAKNGDYCRACTREWRARDRARQRGQVAADVGPDYLALAEAQLYPGRAYASLGTAERFAGVELARQLAREAGAFPAGAAA